MFRQLRAAVTLLAALSILTGVLYPALVSMVAQALFPRLADGSLIHQGKTVVGSDLVGQSFSKPEYFWGRLSATSPSAYNAVGSAGSNFGPLHPGLKEAAEARIADLRGGKDGLEAIPVDLVTASASGLDPHVSPAAAMFQVPRVAAARGMTEEAVREIVRRHTEGRQFGFLGEPRINVLRLNMALDRQQDRR